MQKKILKHEAVIDTCALISLSVTGVLIKCLEIVDILIPEKVNEELIDIAHYSDLDGTHAKSILKTIPEKVKVLKVKNMKRVEYLTDNFSHIDVGEAEVLVLAEERKCVAITTTLHHYLN